MNLRKLLFLCLLLPAGNKIAADNKPVEETIIALERAAMDRWVQGDPDGFIELSTDDVVYIDPFLEQKLEGIDKLKELYETVRGKVEIDRYEFIHPVVQAAGGCAVLTYNYISYYKEEVHKWNCTEVYRLETSGKWKIIHTHWSLVKPLK